MDNKAQGIKPFYQVNMRYQCLNLQIKSTIIREMRILLCIYGYIQEHSFPDA